MTVEAAHGGESLLVMPARAELADAAGAVHEGALAALIDTTGALASWSLTGLDMRFKASTVGIHVNYHAPAAARTSSRTPARCAATTRSSSIRWW